MNEIPTSELFADLQVSCVDIILMEMLPEGLSTERLQGEREIQKEITRRIRERFSDSDIQEFLENGYPRKVVLKEVTNEIS